MRFVGRLPLAKRNLLLLHALTISLHGYLLYQWIDTQHGQNLSTSNMFSFTTWLAGFFLLFSAIKKPVDNLFMFIPPIAAFSILWVIGCPLPNTIHADMTPTNLWHIFIALSAISLLGLAGLQAILVGFQNYA